MAKVGRALGKIETDTAEINKLQAQLDQKRSERNQFVFQTAEGLRPLTGGKPTTSDLARAMGVRPSYARKVLEGRGDPTAV